MRVLRTVAVRRSTPSVDSPMSTSISSSGPSPDHREPDRRCAGQVEKFRRQAALGLLQRQVDRKHTRRVVEPGLQRETALRPVETPEPSSIAEPEPSASCAAPLTDSVAGRPITGSPRTTSSMATSPMLMLTGSSGSAKGVASGVGRSGPSGGRGGRSDGQALRRQGLTSSRPDRSASAPPVESRVFEDQPFAIGVRDAQTVEFRLGGQRAAKPVDPHLAVGTVRQLRFEERDQATAIVVLRMKRAGPARRGRQGKGSGAHQNACPMPI
jgi:hypothetical protein